MPNPGDILHYKDFRFDAGTVKNKFFIVLHADPCLTLITTKQSLRYPMVNKSGCHPEKMTYFFRANELSVFPEPTYLVMQKIYEFQSIH